MLLPMMMMLMRMMMPVIRYPPQMTAACACSTHVTAGSKERERPLVARGARFFAMTLRSSHRRGGCEGFWGGEKSCCNGR